MDIFLAQPCPCSGGSARPWLMFATALICLFAYDRYTTYRKRKGGAPISKNYFVGIAMGIVVILGIVVFFTRQTPPPTDDAPSSFQVPNLTPVSVEGTGRPHLVDLGATECIPCKKMAPILDELKSEYVGRMDVDFIDVWQPQNQAQAEIYGIQSIPTQVFLDPNGQELWRHIGFISKEDLLAKWHELGYDLHP